MTKLDSIGRLLIPKETRKRLDMDKKEYEVIEKDEELIVRPVQKSYRLTENEMDFLRDVLNLTNPLGILDESQLQMFSDICRLTTSKCHKCDSYLYVNANGVYTCRKCKED